MNKWWKNGIAFSCTQCAKCCNARDDMAYVYVNKRERQRIAKRLGIPLHAFTDKYTLRDNDGQHHLRFVEGHCIFLNDKQCAVHDIKPTQCRTWPFWEEVMVSKEEYKKQVLDFCPGSKVEQPVISADSIKQQILETEDAFFEV